MWREFGVAVAGLAGALTGLLFVAVSIKSGELAKSRSLSSRAEQTLVLFMISALAAILLAGPEVPGGCLQRGVPEQCLHLRPGRRRGRYHWLEGDKQ